jgi:hypothetical protein
MTRSDKPPIYRFSIDHGINSEHGEKWDYDQWDGKS